MRGNSMPLILRVNLFPFQPKISAAEKIFQLIKPVEYSREFNIPDGRELSVGKPFEALTRRFHFSYTHINKNSESVK